MKLKFRAEVDEDALQLIRLLQEHDLRLDRKFTSLTITYWKDIRPDCEVIIDSDFSKKEVLQEMKKIPDSHVMMETLEEESKYTGKRK